jgi:hypothetical protein
VPCLSPVAAALGRFWPEGEGAAPPAPEGAEAGAAPSLPGGASALERPGARAVALWGSLAPADRLSAGLAVAHVALLVLVLAAVAGATGLGTAEKLGLVVAMGLFAGQASHPNACDLLHRRSKLCFSLGAAVCVTLLSGHHCPGALPGRHVPAHGHVHHRFVATGDDPATARAGEGVRASVLRVWTGSVLLGHEIERTMAGDGRAAGDGRTGGARPAVPTAAARPASDGDATALRPCRPRPASAAPSPACRATARRQEQPHRLFTGSRRAALAGCSGSSKRVPACPVPLPLP